MKSKSVTIQRYHYAVLSSLAVYYHHFAEHCGAFRGPICSHARVIDPTGLLSFFFFSFLYFLNALQGDNTINAVYVLRHKYVLGHSQSNLAQDSEQFHSKNHAVRYNKK